MSAQNLLALLFALTACGQILHYLQIHIITASCENMIDGKGMRPGDILQAANGKTVEVRSELCAVVLRFTLPAGQGMSLEHDCSCSIVAALESSKEDDDGPSGQHGEDQ